MLSSALLAMANLTPVTSSSAATPPALVCADFPLRTAPEQLLSVKLMNAGQICTSVDYRCGRHFGRLADRVPDLLRK